MYRQHVCMGCRKFTGFDSPQPDRKILSELETEKSGRAKGANGMVGVRPARRDARKSDGGMNEKEKERSESLF